MTLSSDGVPFRGACDDCGREVGIRFRADAINPARPDVWVRCGDCGSIVRCLREHSPEEVEV